MNKHVIIGSGPVAQATAHNLLLGGHEVVSVTRSGNGTMPTGTVRVQADAANRAAIFAVTTGAATIYNCANPAYTKWEQDWPPIAANLLAAAQQHGAVLATMSNLYPYGPSATPFKESDPLTAPGRKARVRKAMWEAALAAHHAGNVRVTEARASDYIGPTVTDATLGERAVPKILLDKSISLLGSLDVPHALTAMHDVGRTLAILGTDERALGRAWHVPTAPAITQRAAVTGLCTAAGVEPVKVNVLPHAVLTALALVVPMMKELKEVEYQFARPFDLDSSAFTQTFGVEPTPLAQTFAETIEWYRSRR